MKTSIFVREKKRSGTATVLQKERERKKNRPAEGVLKAKGLFLSSRSSDYCKTPGGGRETGRDRPGSPALQRRIEIWESRDLLLAFQGKRAAGEGTRKGGPH